MTILTKIYKSWSIKLANKPFSDNPQQSWILCAHMYSVNGYAYNNLCTEIFWESEPDKINIKIIINSHLLMTKSTKQQGIIGKW